MREFWRQVIWYLGHPTEPYSSRAAAYSDGGLTEAERTASGLPIGHVRCVLITQKCWQCGEEVKVAAPLCMSFELINVEHYGDQTHAVRAEVCYEK